MNIMAINTAMWSDSLVCACVHVCVCVCVCEAMQGLPCYCNDSKDSAYGRCGHLTAQCSAHFKLSSFLLHSIIM